MGATSARLVIGAAVETPSLKLKGSPLTLGILCLIAAGLGAMLGASLGSQAEQEAGEAQHAMSSAARHAVSSRQEQKLEQQLQQSRDQLDALGRSGVLQVAKDVEEATRLGLVQALDRDLARMAPDDARSVLAALVREARDNGLDPLFVAAVIRVETHFDPYATSHVGARGLMQLMPATAAEVAQRKGLHITTRQLFNPSINIKLGSAYLKTLIDRFGDVRTALIAYNAGPTLARHAHLSKGVRAYPRNVIAEYERLTWQARRTEAASGTAVASAN